MWFYIYNEYSLCYISQIKTEELNDSPHSASSLKTACLSQSSPVHGGQMSGVRHYQNSWELKINEKKEERQRRHNTRP